VNTGGTSPESNEDTLSASPAAVGAAVSAGAEGSARPQGGHTARPLRKDAERNRQRILQAAMEVFTERGLEATLDDVAHHAGVGVATVYRRFPDKASLADALFEQRIDLLVGAAETAYSEPDAWQALASFMERTAEMMAGDRGMRQMLMFAAYGHDRISYARDRMRPAVGRLVERAQAAGQVREDLTATDIPVIEFMLSVTAEYVRDVRPNLWRRFLVLWLDAMRPARDSYAPLPVEGLTPDEFATVMQTSPLGRHLGNGKQQSVRPQPAPPPPIAPGNTR
jgi:AcrR family transcriptional regulator